MAKRKNYRSEVSEAIHSSAEMLHEVGIFDKKTMRGFDARHLVAEDLSPEDIAQIRNANNVSQPIFASYLNTTKSTVAQWESGAKKPSGIAVRLLRVVARHGIQILDDTGSAAEGPAMPRDRRDGPSTPPARKAS